MALSRKKFRMMILGFGGVVLALSTFLVSMAFRDLIVAFYGPTEAVARAARGDIDPDKRVRIGGLVEEGSIVRGVGEAFTFAVTDGDTSIPVSFVGIPPDLFAEGQGVVTEGYLVGGTFTAKEILAKHDENYMPREVADELKKTGRWKEGG